MKSTTTTATMVSASYSYYPAPTSGRLSSRLTWLLCLTRLFTLIFSQESDTSTSTTTTTTTTIASYACVDPNNRQITHQVRRGEITTVCLYVGPSGSWNSNIDYKRFSVNLIADEFSSYSIPGSFATINENNLFNSDAVHIFAASQSSLSFLRRYSDKSNQRIYPYLTAIIDVQDGIVKGIVWDDACIFCELSKCTPNTYNFDGSLATTEQIHQPVGGCYLTRDECVGFATDGSNVCDLKLHVVWTGTDVNGKALLSSDSRMSMFPPDRIQEKVKNTYNTMIENLKKLSRT